MSSCVIYVLYSGITKRYNWTLLVAIGAILIEGLALILNHWQCPLTGLAKKYGYKRGSVTDMFLPAWFAPRVFPVCATLFTIGLVLLVLNYMMI